MFWTSRALMCRTCGLLVFTHSVNYWLYNVSAPKSTIFSQHHVSQFQHEKYVLLILVTPESVRNKYWSHENDVPAWQETRSWGSSSLAGCKQLWRHHFRGNDAFTSSYNTYPTPGGGDKSDCDQYQEWREENLTDTVTSDSVGPRPPGTFSSESAHLFAM